MNKSMVIDNSYFKIVELTNEELKEKN